MRAMLLRSTGPITDREDPLTLTELPRPAPQEDTDSELLAGIRYEDHLWQVKELKTVANITHRDIAEFLPIAAGIPLHVECQTYLPEAANVALRNLRSGHVRGIKVLKIK